MALPDLVAAHSCRWPITIRTPKGDVTAFHLTDWAARADQPGSGIQVLNYACEKAQAAVGVGGTAATKRILPKIGFQEHNSFKVFKRPLHPLKPALSESPKDLRQLARIGRNAWWWLWPINRLPGGWTVVPIDGFQIPESLWPQPAAGIAVSLRSPLLLEHISRCPKLRASRLFVLNQAGKEFAYFYLAQVDHEVRLADYGPAGLAPAEARVLAIAALSAARTHFPSATDFLAGTSEQPVCEGFEQAGLHLYRHDSIRVRQSHEFLSGVQQFRLTMIDWDAVYLS